MFFMSKYCNCHPWLSYFLTIIVIRYDAAEDNEISFRVGDRITNIEAASDDWWEGTLDGQRGLFPGAYFEHVSGWSCLDTLPQQIM